jgi:uncharacterized membrane protein
MRRNTRERIFRFLMWWSVLGLATWVGGTMFYMLVVVPLWSSSPPDSVRAIFVDAGLNKTIWNFFGPPWMALRNVPLIAALIVGWPYPAHRRLLLVTVLIGILGVAFTLVYMYPINAILMGEPGHDVGAAEMRLLVRQWVIADRIRFAAMTAGLLFLLRAFAIPCPRKQGVSAAVAESAATADTPVR